MTSPTTTTALRWLLSDSIFDLSRFFNYAKLKKASKRNSQGLRHAGCYAARSNPFRTDVVASSTVTPRIHAMCWQPPLRKQGEHGVLNFRMLALSFAGANRFGSLMPGMMTVEGILNAAAT